METPYSCSPNKRLKSETLTLDSPISPSPRKGKAPISDELAISDDEDVVNQSLADLPPQNCGICFSEEGKSVRGLIGSCEHYFCFLCIIEWSKIESRCPLCRARFSNIRRMRRDGSFIGDGSVRVPVRDQIYDPFGEPTDPYAQAKCTLCNGSNDECLLLLCDLCDSAWHTFCVGLGATVPEGDWYCRDCTLLRAEQCNDDNVDSSTLQKNADGESATSASVSIFDIVRDAEHEPEPESGVDRLLKLVSPPTKKFSLSTIGSDRPNMASAGSLQGSRGNLNSPPDATESSARTLLNCRNVRRHISVLRENWGGFRSGSLSFSSNLLGSSGKGRGKIQVVAKCASKSRESQQFASTSSQQPKAQDTSCSDGPNKHPYNVDRAWKLMKVARSMQQVGKLKGASNNNNIPSGVPPRWGLRKVGCTQSLPLSCKLKGVSKTALNTARGSNADNVASKFVTFGLKDLKTPKSGMLKPSNKSSGSVAQRSGEDRLTSIVTEAASSKHQDSYVSRLSSGKVPTTAEDGITGLSTVLNDGSTCSTSLFRPISGAFNASCTKFGKREISTCPLEQVGSVNDRKAEVQTLAQAEICHARFGLPSQQCLGVLSNAFDERKGSACSKSQYEPAKGSSSSSCVKLQGGEIPGCSSKGAAQTVRKISENDEAKGEIQSLVKLNLKLLNKDKRLGADAFKEIAWLSTHTILLACGFEHRKIVHS